MQGDLKDFELVRSYFRDAADSPLALALRRVLETELSELLDITNVDLDGNVGLQTTARRMAYDRLSALWSRLGFSGLRSPSQKPSSSFE